MKHIFLDFARGRRSAAGGILTLALVFAAGVATGQPTTLPAQPSEEGVMTENITSATTATAETEATTKTTATQERDATPATDDALHGEAFTAQHVWDEGNRAYIDGNYRKAAECYTSILDHDLYSAELYYNLANACFKTGETGRAILYYNKALKINPSNDDVRHNLAIAEAQTRDKIAVVPEFFFNRWLRTIRNGLSCTAWSILSLAALALLLASMVLFLLARRLGWRKAGFYCALISLLALFVTAGMGIAERRDMLQREQAIVMSSSISVKSSPDRSATDLFVLHEGTKVRVVTEVGEWYEIVIADGKKGWTESRNIEKI